MKSRLQPAASLGGYKPGRRLVALYGVGVRMLPSVDTSVCVEVCLNVLLRNLEHNCLSLPKEGKDRVVPDSEDRNNALTRHSLLFRK